MTERELFMSPAARSRRDGDGATRRRGPWVIRAYDAGDADAVSRLDTSYSSDQVYAVHRSGDVVALAPTSITVPHSKRGVIDIAAGAPAHGWVALLDGRVRGFLGWDHDAAARRMTIAAFHVDRPYRRRGAGRALIDAALDWAGHTGAITLWLETSSVNHAGIAAYRRLGFEICGFDTALYRGTANHGEVAVYMARLVDGEERR